MQLIKLSQSQDREAWLDARRGKIGGSDAKNMKPLTRGADKTPSGFWELLAENLAIAKDGEPERDRGHRLENEALSITAKKYNLNLNLDAGMWISDVDDNISVSPDAAEDAEIITYAAEAKCLDSKNHLKAIVQDKRARNKETYNPIDSLKIDARTDFSYQARQYFIVNENLETLYFTFYDDRIVLDNLVHYTIVIKRSEILGQLEQQTQDEVDILNAVKELIKELKQWPVI